MKTRLIQIQDNFSEPMPGRMNDESGGDGFPDSRIYGSRRQNDRGSRSGRGRGRVGDLPIDDPHYVGWEIAGGSMPPPPAPPSSPTPPSPPPLRPECSNTNINVSMKPWDLRPRSLIPNRPAPRYRRNDQRNSSPIRETIGVR